MLFTYSMHYPQHWEEKEHDFDEKVGLNFGNVHKRNLYLPLSTIISRGTFTHYEDYCNVFLALNLPHTIVFMMCTGRYANLSCRKKPDRGKQYILSAKDMERPSLEI